jgi:hypothetical protein
MRMAVRRKYILYNKPNEILWDVFLLWKLYYQNFLLGTQCGSTWCLDYRSHHPARWNATQFSFVREGIFQFEFTWTLRSVKQIQQHDPAPTQNQHFLFYNEVMTYLPPQDGHRDKTVAAFANIYAGMLNHAWGNQGHNTFVTCAITTFSTVKIQKNLKCKRTWRLL